MTDWPGVSFVPPLLGTASPLSGLLGETACMSQEAMATAVAFPAANRAIYLPVEVPELVTVYQIAALLSTASGNFDAGIYDEEGTRLASVGSTAAANGVQAYNIADTVLKPGLYYLAVASDNTTTKLTGTNAWPALQLQSLGVRQEAAAFPLPATATFANPTTAFFPVVFASTMQATV